MEPLVYFILVNYNGYKDTIVCIESLLKINYTNYKIIIVDNYSIDNSLEKLQQIKSEKIKLINLDENLGFSGGNNIGINLAMENHADFIVLLNNDTIVTKDFLKPLIEGCGNNGNTITTSKIMYAKEKNKIWYGGGNTSFKLGRSWHNNINKVEKTINEEIKEVSFISGCCMCIPKSVIEIIGTLSEDYFLYYEDTDYCCRAIKKGIKLLYIPTSIIYHNVSSSTGHNSPLMTYYKIRNRLYFIQEHVPNKYKFFAELVFFMEVCAGLLITKYDLTSVKQAIIDYRNKVIGKKINKKLINGEVI